MADPVSILEDDTWATPADLVAPYEIPAEWTVEHVARRYVEAFEVLLAMSGRVGPRAHANGWPVMLQEFSDLVDEDAMKNARDAFAEARGRPSADEISRSDETLGWAMRFGADRAIDMDAIQVWALCRAGSFSIKAALRRRVAKALVIAAKMNEGEELAVARARKVLIRDATSELEAAARAEGVLDLPEPTRTERWTAMRVETQARVAATLAEMRPRFFEPHHAMPEKVLSSTSLDRHRYAGLNLLAGKLSEARVPVR